VLDKLLVDAAGEAGADVREGFAVEGLVVENGQVVGVRGRGRGETVTEKARLVIGADGKNSVVAKAVRPAEYHARPALAVWYYTYWSRLPADGVEIFIRPRRGAVAVATNDGLTLVAVGWPAAELAANRGDIEAAYKKTLDGMPRLAERVRTAAREERFVGTSVSSFFRKPFGPGWALVGDAGYTKDPVTALGISDAFYAAERCARAVDEALTGACAYDEAMAAYQAERDEHSLPLYELTCELAMLEPPQPELQQLLAAAHGNREAMNDWVSTMAGTLPAPEFFAPANVKRILAAASPATAQSS
jgi:flavin-dependent dehydrogenase